MKIEKYNMSPEIELKLLVNQGLINSIKQELSHFKLIKQQQVFSQNIYFDTQDHFFSRQKMGLRVRKENECYTMTLKTAGKVQGGLHIRPEYNVNLSCEKPDLTLFHQYSELQLAQDYAVLQSSLMPIFSTDFQREYYVLETGSGTQLEIAIDQGKILANQQQAPISEIEIELKTGSVLDVLNFVQNLLFLDGIRIGQESKAERGYQLAGLGKKSKPVLIEDWRNLLHQSFPTAHQKVVALLDYEWRLLKYLEKVNTQVSVLDGFATIELIGLFFNLYQYYENEPQLLAQLLMELPVSQQEIVEELQETNQMFYQQIKQMIARHVEQQDHTKAIQQLLEFTSRGKYLQRMINLLKVTLK
ncbi:inorganic triphosphatase [Gallibacterium trehalosifermentans]|uniref:Inorganic triphosphatase n=1 Tax=Gallibacterium trehalosifermentans TaxID=516935 RepID=A0ABV6H1A4_9PAST